MSGKTEWEDALIKHGIREAPKQEKTQDELQTEFAERMNDRDVLASKTLGELDEVEDDFDEDVIEAHRRKRIAEMKQQALRSKYGHVKQIGQTEFVSEVSEGSKDIPVVCHLFSNGKEECSILNHVLDTVAQRFPQVKFVKIIVSEAIKNFPEQNCPTILVYKKGEMLFQFAQLSAFGGRKVNADVVEWVLSGTGILTTTLESDPRENLFRINRERTQIENNLGSDDDEWLSLNQHDGMILFRQKDWQRIFSMTPLEEKAKGNALYAEGSFEEAREVYEHAIARLAEGEDLELASVLHANAAACCFNLKDYTATVKFCTNALSENPAYHKAKLRRAMAHDALEQYEEAVKDLESLQESEFEEKRITVLLRTCKASLEKQREAQKEEMLGKLKDLGNSILGNFGMSLDQFQAVQDPKTGSYSIQTKNQGVSE